MAIVQVKLKVIAPETCKYFIAVDEKELMFVNGEATIPLTSGEEHILIWRLIGNSGDSVSIVGTVNGKEVVNVKEGKIPPGKTKAAGYRRFTP